MNSNFFKLLKQSKKSYSWTIDDSNSIVATMEGRTLNPIEAVASFVGIDTSRENFKNKRNTLKLAKAMGLDSSFAEQVYDAAKCLKNRGQAQIVRGKLRNALGI